jgi:hypothetical protein
VWNADEVKFTGAFDCADSWHETDFGLDLDAANTTFTADLLGTESARYRVQAVKSEACPGSQATGLVGVQSIVLMPDARAFTVGTMLTGAGKFSGRIRWDASGAVPEGGVR